MSNLLPLPTSNIRVRPGTIDDLAFIDALQKQHTKQVGWMPTKTLEGKINAGHVLVAEEVGSLECGVGRTDASSLQTPHSPLPTCLGYCIGNDQYFKRDDVGIIYQMNVVPGRQRGLIGATLLKAQFERSAYGCRLYCCWCAQDIAANRFWEAMGFTALAFRSGSASKGPKGSARVHIFWQRRIRSGDHETPWWFPSQTTGGSIREDRLVLPIPPDTHWSDAKPIVLPGMAKAIEAPAQKRLPGRRSRFAGVQPTEKPKDRIIGGGGMRFSAPKPVEATQETVKAPAPKREPRKKHKNDPKLVAAARELRDRWLEQLNSHGPSVNAGKYDISRIIDSRVTIEVNALPAPRTPLLAA